MELSRNNNYTTRIILDYLYQQQCHKHIDVDLSRQTNVNILQQINFIERL